jgi:acetolactate synthase-1/2/3 large subunit
MTEISSSGARLLIKTLERHGVRFVFGIPGAKIDSVFDELENSRCGHISSRRHCVP